MRKNTEANDKRMKSRSMQANDKQFPLAKVRTKLLLLFLLLLDDAEWNYGLTFAKGNYGVISNFLVEEKGK